MSTLKSFHTHRKRQISEVYTSIYNIDMDILLNSLTEYGAGQIPSSSVARQQGRWEVLVEEEDSLKKSRKSLKVKSLI